MSTGIKDLSKSVKAGGATAVLTAVLGVGAFVQEHLVVKSLTESNRQLILDTQKQHRSFQEAYGLLQDKFIACYERERGYKR